jgi:rare lipoprotein A
MVIRRNRLSKRPLLIASSIYSAVERKFISMNIRILLACFALIFVITEAPARSAETASDNTKTHQISSGQNRPNTQVGQASWYGPWHRGKPTASGEPMNPDKLAAASKTLPIGSTAEVTNLANGRTVQVKINDRGPYVKGRVIDLTEKAAEQLGMKYKGVTAVTVTQIEERDAGQQADDPRRTQEAARERAHADLN